MESNLGFLSLMTIVELYWVLLRAYSVSTMRWSEVIEGLLSTGSFESIKPRLSEQRSFRAYTELTSRMLLSPSWDVSWAVSILSPLIAVLHDPTRCDFWQSD
jgi:hypothetical protein